MTLRFFLPLCAGAGIAVLSGCAGVGTAIGGLAEKSLSGSGTVAVQRVGKPATHAKHPRLEHQPDAA